MEVNKFDREAWDRHYGLKPVTYKSDKSFVPPKLGEYIAPKLEE